MADDTTSKVDKLGAHAVGHVQQDKQDLPYNWAWGARALQCIASDDAPNLLHIVFKDTARLCTTMLKGSAWNSFSGDFSFSNDHLKSSISFEHGDTLLDMAVRNSKVLCVAALTEFAPFVFARKRRLLAGEHPQKFRVKMYAHSGQVLELDALPASDTILFLKLVIEEKWFRFHPEHPLGDQCLMCRGAPLQDDDSLSSRDIHPGEDIFLYKKRSPTLFFIESLGEKKAIELDLEPDFPGFRDFPGFERVDPIKVLHLKQKVQKRTGIPVIQQCLFRVPALVQQRAQAVLAQKEANSANGEAVDVLLKEFEVKNDCLVSQHDINSTFYLKKMPAGVTELFLTKEEFKSGTEK
jgi:hypothetical protein